MAFGGMGLHGSLPYLCKNVDGSNLVAGLGQITTAAMSSEGGGYMVFGRHHLAAHLLHSLHLLSQEDPEPQRG